MRGLNVTGSTLGTGARLKGSTMTQLHVHGSKHLFLVTFFFAATALLPAQNDYKVVTVSDGGTISGAVKWSGQLPRELGFPIAKDQQICDPESKKTTDLDRLIV